MKQISDFFDSISCKDNSISRFLFFILLFLFAGFSLISSSGIRVQNTYLRVDLLVDDDILFVWCLRICETFVLLEKNWFFSWFSIYWSKYEYVFVFNFWVTKFLTILIKIERPWTEKKTLSFFLDDFHEGLFLSFLFFACCVYSLRFIHCDYTETQLDIKLKFI